jgi:hypothetical protein
MTVARPRWHWLLGWLGFAALLAALPFYLASGLLAPGWAIAVLMIVWLALKYMLLICDDEAEIAEPGGLGR